MTSKAKLPDINQDWSDARNGVQSRWLDITLAELGSERVLIVGPNTPVSEVVALMNEADQGAVLVMNQDVLVGIFTERDAVRRALPLPNSMDLPVSALMTPKPCVLTESRSFAEAIDQLARGRHHHLPVMNAVGQPTKLISLQSIVAHLVKTFPDEILQGALERDTACARASGQWPAILGPDDTDEVVPV